MNSASKGRELTGRMVLAIFVAAFGVIIAVNLLLAWNAVRTFPGLEVRNSYVASQGFNEALREQRALGWEVRVAVVGERLEVRFTDADGAPASVASFQASLGRATHVRDDVTPAFTYEDGVFVAPVDIALGNWNLRLVATAADGTEFRQRVSFWHRG